MSVVLCYNNPLIQLLLFEHAQVQQAVAVRGIGIAVFDAGAWALGRLP